MNFKRGLAVAWKSAAGLSFAIAVVFVGDITRTTALACSCGGGGEQFIKNNDSDDQTIVVPKDARGVLWWSGGMGQRQNPRKDEFTVHLLSGPKEREVDFELVQIQPSLFVIAPANQLSPGDRYRFTRKPQEPRKPHPRSVEAIVENTSFAEIKNDLGIWLSDGARTSIRLAASASCSRSADVISRQVQAIESEAIDRWRFALLFETIVDGKSGWRPRADLCDEPAPGGSWQGRGIDWVFAECAGTEKNREGLSEGSHEVYVTISLPGTGMTAKTKSASFNLNCPTEPK